MADEQLTLFDTDESAAPSSDRGFRAPAVQNITGVTYRQLDYWARTHVVEPTIAPAKGSGSQRLYSFTDIVLVKLVKRLLDTGISLQNVRKAIDALRARGASAEELATITLVGDGVSVYEVSDSGDLFDLLQGGQCVFSIAVKATFEEVRGDLVHFPSEAGVGTEAAAASGAVADELAARRARRAG